jgi:tetratricopeptide (TPR) repeat protein
VEARYLMADSYRASAIQMGERATADANMPPSEVGRLNAIRDDQLRMALDLFGQVSESIVADANGKAAMYQQHIIRRAALYRADCAFQLREFAQAIDLYDHAARQYSDHQSSMYALIQIVNAYNALGDSERAAAAHHRALVRLKQLPEEAFHPTEALMDRAAWEQWLESNPVSPARTAAAAAPTG